MLEQENTASDAPEIDAAVSIEAPEAETFETAGADDAPEAKVKEEKVVPLAALHEERNKRREIAAQLEQYRREGQQRIDALYAAFQRQQQMPQVQAPDPARDPFGATIHETQQVKSQVDQITHHLLQEKQQRMVQEQQAQIVTRAQQLDRDFQRRQPDAVDAIKFLKDGKAAEYVAAGATQEQAQTQVQMDEWNLVVQALNRGENPAEVAYEIAKARGYVTPAKKLDMQKQGRNASTPSGGSGKGGGKLSLDALLALDSKDFAKATSGDAWRALMGG